MDGWIFRYANVTKVTVFTLLNPKIFTVSTTASFKKKEPTSTPYETLKGQGLPHHWNIGIRGVFALYFNFCTVCLYGSASKQWPAHIIAHGRRCFLGAEGWKGGQQWEELRLSTLLNFLKPGKPTR